MIGVSGCADAGSVWIMNLFQRPRRAVESAPGITTGRKPCPPIADIFKVSRRQKPFAEVWPISGALGFASDPICAANDVWCYVPQPCIIPCKAVMLGQRPQNPSLVLVIAAVFITARSIKDAVCGIKITRKPRSALIVQPRIETIFGDLMITPAIEIKHHHAGFVGIDAVPE